MASNIDPTKPEHGNALTANMRANFQAAADEIGALQNQTQNLDASGVIDADSVDDSATTNKFTTAEDISKLAGIEENADVTDATNVDAAGATMNADTDVSGNSWVLDEDDFASDSATKVPTQQSVKAYVDTAVAPSTGAHGTVTTGTVTPEQSDGDFQTLTNGGAFTLAAPTEEGAFILTITNNASAGAVTLSGFDDELGDSFDTTDGNVFECAIMNTGSRTSIQVTAATDNS